MRLIDADALFREMEKAQWYNNADRDEIAEELVLNAPTIEPERKKGKWIVTSEFEDCNSVKCHQCKVTQVFYYNKPLTNYCPNCGAKMEV